MKEKKDSGLWDVETNTTDDSGAGHKQSIKVLIEVEDTNDPPQFNVTVKDVILAENTPTGTWVETVAAVDPDSSPTKKIR